MIMRNAFAAALLLAASLGPVAAPAKPVEEKNVLSGKVTFDPASGYIFLTGPARQFGMFLRVPDDATRAAWERERQKAFDKALKSYRSDYAQWKANAAVRAEHKLPPEAQPVEPTLETFRFDPVDLRDLVSFGPQFVYAKGAAVSYLEAVKPGTYIWYGNVMGGNGLPAGGVCNCMGTVQFEVKAGVVTDLGNWLLAAPRIKDEIGVGVAKLAEDNARRVAEGKAPHELPEFGDIRFGLPASLKGWPSARAEFHASGKLNNYFAVYIGRLPHVPGVLGYRRDAVIDERTGEQVHSPTLVTMQKLKF